MRGAAFGGGAARGPFAAGRACATFSEWGVVGGTSVGSITAAKLAEYPVGDESAAFVELKERWLGLRTKNVHKRHCPFGSLSFWKTGVRDMSPLRKYLKKHLDPQKIKDSGRKLVVTTVVQATKDLVLYTEKDADDIVDIAMASCAIPFAFELQAVDGVLMWDGGVRCVVPVEPLAARGCEIIDAYCCFPKVLPVSEEPKNMLESGLQAVDAQSHEIQENDLVSAPQGVVVNAYRPDRDLGDGLDFSPATNAWRWKLGMTA